MKLLMVEDNELDRKLLREVLRHKGHTAEEALTAAEAIAALSRMPAPTWSCSTSTSRATVSRSPRTSGPHRRWLVPP
jgi:DNA-binding NtrC family response regulator